LIRAGVWPDTVKQGSAGRLKLPGSTLTVAGYGCLLCCWVQALRDLEVDPSATPASVIAATKDLTGQARVWFAGLPVQPQLGKAFGLTAGEVVRCPPQPAQVMRQTIADALAVGLVILHVDHDSTRGGDLEGDHFVLGRRLEGDRIVYADPATGEEGSLDLRTLSGAAVWPSGTRAYQVRSARPVAHLPKP